MFSLAPPGLIKWSVPALDERRLSQIDTVQLYSLHSEDQQRECAAATTAG